MTRKSILLGAALLALLAGAVSTALALLVRHEPEFYHSAFLPPGPERKKQSDDFQSKCMSLINGITNDRSWEERFSDAQINSYLDEGFIRSGINDRMLPEGINQPRISFGPGTVRLAFRYGGGSWCSTVVSIDFRVWLCKETNVVALELQALRAGSLPITAQSLLERVSEAARRQDIEVTWYRHDGNPVALLRFQANQPRPTVRLRRLELKEGELVIGGTSVEAEPLRAMLGVPEGTRMPAAE